MLRKLGFGRIEEVEQDENKTKIRSSKEDEPEWDRKKVLIAFAVILFLIYAFLSTKDFFVTQDADVKGISDVAEKQSSKASEATQRARDRIDQIKENVNNLNVLDVATSSPQIQKVINDIKALESLPRDQAKSACEKICSGL